MNPLVRIASVSGRTTSPFLFREFPQTTDSSTIHFRFRIFISTALIFQVRNKAMTTEFPEKTCSIERLVTHEKLVSAALNGSKTQQRRAGVYGYPGERFVLEGTEFEVTGLRQECWADITEEDAQREGYPNLQMYRALIERMHQGMDWDENQQVWVHDFEIVKTG